MDQVRPRSLGPSCLASPSSAQTHCTHITWLRTTASLGRKVIDQVRSFVASCGSSGIPLVARGRFCVMPIADAAFGREMKAQMGLRGHHVGPRLTNPSPDSEQLSSCALRLRAASSAGQKSEAERLQLDGPPKFRASGIHAQMIKSRVFLQGRLISWAEERRPGSSNFSDRVLLAARPRTVVPGYPEDLRVGIFNSYMSCVLHHLKLLLLAAGSTR